MLTLEELRPGISLVGIEPTVVATVVAAVSIAEGAIQVIYKTPDGTIKDRLLGRADEKNISLALLERPWAFDGDGEHFKLAVEAKRIDLAFLFDPMMAVNYLHEKIAGVLGNPDAIVTIHGGTHRDERRRIQVLFRSDPEVRVLVATDAAGEGVNLQNANLMVNYDLPWNPNRLEQRFGRIHRINQTEVCHLWNVVAKETRAGAVFHRLLEKLSAESAALKGRVFDILSEVFEGNSLKDLLLEAILYGDQPEVRARLSQKVEKAFELLGGSIYQRESGRFEITHAPGVVRERDRQVLARHRACRRRTR